MGMVATSEIVTFLIICAYGSVSGFKDAILYSRLGADAFTWNEHLVFMTERIILVLAIVFGSFGFGVAGGILAFSFFHNGFYYTQRDRIDGSYPERWWAMTKGSSAHFEFTVKVRTTMLILGILVTAAGIIKVYHT